MRRLFSLISGLAVIVLVLAGMPVFAQSTTTPPRLIFQASIPGLNLSKYPDIATFDRTVHIGTNDNRQSAVYLSKADSSQTFGSLEVLGDAPGQADFSPVSIATGTDGSVHIAWINQRTRQLLYRTKPANGSFGATRTVLTSGGFPASINIAVASDGAIYIAWRLADTVHRVVRLANSNASPTGPYLLGTGIGINFPYLATGPQGQVAVAYTSASGDFLQIFLGIWNGNGFDIQQVSQANSNYADPSATYDPDGNLLVAWRGIEGESGSGVWLGTYQGNSRWQIDRVSNTSTVNDIPNVQADSQGNLHLAWISQVSGEQRVFYAFRPEGGALGNPISAPNPGGSIFNTRMAVNIGDEAYAHVLTEFFQGDGTTTSVRYYLFAATSAPAVGATPVIEDGDAYDERETAVQVSFTNVQGTPTQIRWRWGSAPNDTTSDSGGWQSYANPMNIPVLQSILDNTACTPVALYTQVREADGDTGGAQSDQITFDVGISARVIAANPYIRYRAGTFNPMADTAGLTVTAGLGEAYPADFGAEGANDGDPGYTRLPVAYVEVRGLRECSGLRSFNMGRSALSLGKAVTVTNDLFANVLGYPSVMTVGSNEMLLRVVDKVGNFTDYPQTIIYDPNKPILSSSAADSLTATSIPTATILTRLSVKNVTVADTYSSRGFWGVWVANSRTAVTDPATSADLQWYPIQVPGTSSTFDISWSLGSGLSASQVTPGVYHIYMRFLDGAGNATDGVISTTVTISQLTRPKTELPQVRR
ncbi:MAG: hypothetical protein HGA45_25730 [Chloroflexales bacterium]|nr:hypothetical protein [Chloroflexales bacterium]